MPPTGFALQRVLATGAGWEMWRANRSAAAESVVVKFASSRSSSELASVRLHREFQILQDLTCDGVAHPIDLEHSGSDTVLLLKDDAIHESLQQLLRAGPLPLPRFFTLASRLATALGNVHQSGVYHGALRPEHILIGSDDELTVAGFDRATRIPQERFAFESAQRLDPEELPYLSPEQTGRVNRPVDYRTDIYSIGVVLYLLLTGKFPYQAKDTVGWMHAHVALPPVPLRDRRPDVSAALDAIVRRTLEKSPQSRYQNAFALASDLQAAALEGSASPEPFETNTDTVSARFSLSQRLYGREDEARRLADVFSQVAAGERRLVLVAGYSGIGKTALVNETHLPLTERRGAFVSGKFDQFQRATPYSAVRQAFGDLVARLAGGADKESHATRIRERLGSQIGVVAEVLPELELLVGEVSAPPPLAANDAQERFRRVFCRFVAALAREEQPLVVFLDDLQWVDAAGLKLIEALVGADEISHFLLVGAYRDNEIDPGHPLRAAIGRMRAANRSMTSLMLSPLRREHLTELIEDSLGRSAEDSAELAGLVWDKTEGNPFFARQFLRSLALDEVLTFDFKANAWHWDPDRIEALDVTDNVVDLMVLQLGRLDPRSVDALKLAACAGNSFNLATISVIAECPAHQIERELFVAAAVGLIVPIEGREWLELGARGADLVDTNAGAIRYRFRHDRVQQAAYSLIDPQTLPALHLRLARALDPGRDSGERIFEAVAHFTSALGLLVDRQECESVASLFLRAARRAAAATAYAAAAEYGATAIDLAGGDDSWQRMPALAYESFVLRGQCMAVLGRHEDAERSYSVALSRCESRLGRVEILALKMEMFVTQGKLASALQSLIDALALLDIDLTPDNIEAVAAGAAARVALARGNRTAEEILEVEATTDPHTQAQLDLLGRSIDTAYMYGRSWVIAVTSLAVCIALERGMAVPASMTLSTYGLLDAEPNTAEGCRRRAEYGAIGAAIARRFGAEDWVSRSNVSNPQQYGRRFWEAVEAFDKAAQAGWSSNAVTWGGYGEVRAVFMMLSAGADLDRLDRERIERQARIDRANQMVSSACCNAIEALIRGLRDDTAAPWLLGGDARTNREFEQHTAQFGPWAMCKWYAAQQILAAVFGEHGEARRAAEDGASTRHALLGMCHEHLHYVLVSLTAAGLQLDTEPSQRQVLVDEVAEALAFVEARAAVVADFEPSVLLVRGAQAELLGAAGDALDAYNRAAQAGQRLGQPLLEALAFERASEVAAGGGHRSLRDFYLGQARATYERWGASAKVRQLDAQLTAAPSRGAAAAQTLPEQLSRADVESLLKAVRALSGELRFDELVRRLMAILLENGSAQRGLLALVRGDRLWLEAQSILGPDGLRTELIREELAQSEAARPIIERVRNTGRPVLIEDFDVDGPMGRANTSKDQGPRSSLCLPVTNKGAVTGVVYLENRETTHAFVPGGTAVLGLLVGQVATALENAELYRELSAEVAERQRAEDAMRAERDYTARIIETSPIVVCGISRDGTTAFVNPASERLTGRRGEELVGEPWWETVHPQAGAELARLRTELREHGHVRDFELPVTDASGDVHVVEWSCVQHLAPDGAVLQVVCFGRDVTAIRDAQREHADFERALRKSQRLETVGTLAAGIAHDFNNVLVPILGYADLLGDETQGNNLAAEFVEEIKSAATKATKVVAQLMTASHQRTTSERAVVSQVIRDVCALLVASQRANIDVQCHVPQDCPPVALDPGQLHQALLNLGTNAAQAMMATGGALVFEAEVRVVGAEEANQCVRLEPGPAVVIRVRDEGPGMSPEICDRIFEPFFTTKAPGAGSGLGLWMVHGIAESCGGGIVVESTPGSGTTFTLYLPAAPIQTSTLRAPAAALSPRGDARVLLVDDDQQIVRVATTALTRLGYSVTSTSDPHEALETLRASPEQFDVLITDFNMPGLRGSDLAAGARSVRSDLPIILVTGAAEIVGASQPGDIAIDRVVQKPLTGRMLAAAIREVLGARDRDP